MMYSSVFSNLGCWIARVKS